MASISPPSSPIPQASGLRAPQNSPAPASLRSSASPTRSSPESPNPQASGLRAPQNSPVPESLRSSASPTRSSPESPNLQASGLRAPQNSPAPASPTRSLSPLLPEINVGTSRGHTDLTIAANFPEHFPMLKFRPPPLGLQQRRAERRRALGMSRSKPKVAVPSAAATRQARSLVRLEKHLRIDMKFAQSQHQIIPDNTFSDAAREELRLNAHERCRIETENAVEKLANKIFPRPDPKRNRDRVEFESKKDRFHGYERQFFTEPVELRSGRKVFLGVCECRAMRFDSEELPSPTESEEET